MTQMLRCPHQWEPWTAVQAASCKRTSDGDLAAHRVADEHADAEENRVQQGRAEALVGARQLRARRRVIRRDALENGVQLRDDVLHLELGAGARFVGTLVAGPVGWRHGHVELLLLAEAAESAEPTIAGRVAEVVLRATPTLALGVHWPRERDVCGRCAGCGHRLCVSPRLCFKRPRILYESGNADASHLGPWSGSADNGRPMHQGGAFRDD